MKDSHIIIKTFQGIENPQAVYVLSRGQNSGKPLDASCPNCFQILAPDPLQARAVARILFESGRLRPHLIGTAIEFVRLHDYRNLYLQVWDALDPKRAEDVSAKLDAIDQYLKASQEQLKKIKQLRHSLAVAALH